MRIAPELTTPIYRAKDEIRFLPDGPARESLLALADYIVGRNV